MKTMDFSSNCPTCMPTFPSTYDSSVFSCRSPGEAPCTSTYAAGIVCLHLRIPAGLCPCVRESWNPSPTEVEVKHTVALRRFSHVRRKQTANYLAGGYAVLDVALNPAVLRDGNVENREVCALALRFAQKHYGLSVCQDFTVIGCSPNSSTDEIYRRLRFRQRPIASEPVKGLEFNNLEMLLSSFLWLFFVRGPNITSEPGS